jgi:hypothetical protein
MLQLDINWGNKDDEEEEDDGDGEEEEDEDEDEDDCYGGCRTLAAERGVTVIYFGVFFV